MKQTALFSGIAATAFFSTLLFGWGAFQQAAAPGPAVRGPASAIPARKLAAGSKAAWHSHVRRRPPLKKAPPKKAALKKAALPAAASNRGFAETALLAGGFGLLLSALGGLGLSRFLSRAVSHSSSHTVSHSGSAPQTPAAAVRRSSEAEETARQKRQEELETRLSALTSQLSDAEQRTAEAEAQREQVTRQFQEFFRTLPVPCFCFAPNGRITQWNTACEVLYGIPAARALESTLWETIVPASELEPATVGFSRVLAGESLHGVERRDRVAGSGLTRLQCSMVPLCDATGEVVGGLCVGMEMPKLAEYDQQIAALKAQMEAMPPAAALEASQAIAGSALPGEYAGHPAFRAKLGEELERAGRYHAPLTLILLDLDNFAARNRISGFAAGDQALQAAVTTIQSKIRTVDVLARLGADEYALILPETGDAGARIAAERLRAGLAGTGSDGLPPLTACFGVAQLTPDISDAEVFVIRALEALQSAKSSGANSVVHYQDLPESERQHTAGRSLGLGALSL